MKIDRYVLYDIEEKESDKKMEEGENVLIQFCLGIGILGLFFCFFSGSEGRMVLLGVLVGVILYKNIIKRFGKQKGIWNHLPLVLGVLFLFIQPFNASQGFLFLCNQWIDLWNRCFNEIEPQLRLENVTSMGRIQVLTFLVILAIVWVYHQIEKKKVVAIGAMVLTLIFVTAVFQLGIGIFWIGIMISGWLMLWVESVSPQRSFLRKVCLILTGMVLLLVLSGIFINYMGNARVMSTKEKIVEEVRKIRYGNDTLPQGNMKKADEMVGSKENKTLILTLKQAQEMYLRGFVGGTFDGTEWKILPYSSYNQEEALMINWLESQNFETSFQYSAYETYTGENNGGENQNISVKNTGASRRYLYLPYEASKIISGSTAMNRDYQMKTKGIFGQKTYTFENCKKLMPTENMVQKELDLNIPEGKEYHQQENVYRSFVSDNYLDLTEEQKNIINKEFFNEEDWSEKSLYEITNQIRIVLQKLTTYVEKPKEYTGQKEFVSWFLEETKKGNAAYYATVAVFAYRQAGIPARYVEGYHLTNANAQKANQNGDAETEKTITLTEADAHAWVEVYLDDIGWMPIEVVPGFYYAQYTSQKIEGAPQSSVNIANQTEEQVLEGSTTDNISPEPTHKEKVETPAKKMIRVAGILLLLVIILWVLQLLILLQYRIRRMLYRKRMKRLSKEEQGRIYYQHVNDVLKAAGIPIKEDYPFENTSLVLEACPEICEFEYKRFVILLEKVVFGGDILSEAEYVTVQSFDEKITGLLLEKTKLLKRLQMKYWKALV